jgi:hypothetical protein
VFLLLKKFYYLATAVREHISIFGDDGIGQNGQSVVFGLKI